MPIMLDSIRGPEAEAGLPAGCTPLSGFLSVPNAWLEIGLVNNMPDAALQATERQFIELLDAAAGPTPVRLHFYALPQIQRGPAIQRHLREHYRDAAELGRTPLDALIVTGNEPRASSLDDEPYWKSLTAVVDWAQNNTTSTIYSCLAAHAAVLHLDGVRRRRLPTKCSGVYRCLPVGQHPLLAQAGPRLLVPHSRWNDLAEADLVANGYTVLTRAAGVGVDTFVKQGKSLSVFFQGHPEYHVDSLLREYRRDVGRFMRGELSAAPTMPSTYFSRVSEKNIETLMAQLSQSTQSPTLPEFMQAMQIRRSLVHNWRASVVPLLGNWLHFVGRCKQREAA